MRRLSLDEEREIFGHILCDECSVKAWHPNWREFCKECGWKRDAPKLPKKTTGSKPKKVVKK